MNPNTLPHSAATWFISDLHLDESVPAITLLFQNFIREITNNATALYILGDFFEAWLGDDDDSTFNQSIIAELRQAADQGLPIYLMTGNRDFLLGTRFAEAAHIQLIQEPYVVNLYGTPTVLLHGDALCTLDQRYQRWRRLTNSRSIRQLVSKLPLAWRRALASYLRSQSRQYTAQQRHTPLMDVTDTAVLDLMQAQRVTRLIHGHTHRPAIHALTIQNQPAERIVLGAWHDAATLLRYDADGYQLIDYAVGRPSQ